MQSVNRVEWELNEFESGFSAERGYEEKGTSTTHDLALPTFLAGRLPLHGDFCTRCTQFLLRRGAAGGLKVSVIGHCEKFIMVVTREGMK